MKFNGYRLYSSILGYANFKFSVFARNKREASRLIAYICNEVDLCPWHTYSASEVYDCLSTPSDLTCLLLFQKADDLSNGLNVIDKRRLAYVQRQLLTLRNR